MRDWLSLIFILLVLGIFHGIHQIKARIPVDTSKIEALSYTAKLRFKGLGPGLLFGESMDLNRVTKEELELIPGLGAKRALKVLQARNESGFFLSREEIVRPYGPLPPTLYECAKDYVL